MPTLQHGASDVQELLPQAYTVGAKRRGGVFKTEAKVFLETLLERQFFRVLLFRLSRLCTAVVEMLGSAHLNEPLGSPLPSSHPLRPPSSPTIGDKQQLPGALTLGTQEEGQEHSVQPRAQSRRQQSAIRDDG